ncbi:MAG: hypothetical protein A2039_03465 [Candidatus Melainabacteria bacterium GWA2_34_9]|nr:MAG: hypothetical protein A2039_03465 [Candidatus Melainabacteria bacterium GWA2_34_9]
MNGIISNYNYVTPKRQNSSIGFGNQATKLGKQFLNGSKNLTGENAVALLKRLGYTAKETGSSHHVYRNPVGDMVNLALHNIKQQLKPYQIENVADAIKKAGGLSVFA